MAELRSVQREEERSKALLKRLTARPERVDRLPDEVPGIAEEVGAMWRGGVEPMPFDQWFFELDGQRLFPGPQENIFDIPDIWRANKLFSNTRTITEWVLVFGKGSLVGSTKLCNHKTKETLPIEEWYRRGEPLFIKSWDGYETVVLQTSPVFCKGAINTLTVILEDGRSVSVSPDHRFLTPTGWKTARGLEPGYDVVGCSLEHDALYDRSHSPLAQGCRDDYHAYLRSYDEPLLQRFNIYQGTAPLRSDEWQSDLFAWHGDAPSQSCRGNVASGSWYDRARIREDAYQPLVVSGNSVRCLQESDVSPRFHAELALFL